MGKSGKLFKTLVASIKAFKFPPSKQKHAEKEKSGRHRSNTHKDNLGKLGSKDKCLWSLGKSSSRNCDSLAAAAAFLDATETKSVEVESSHAKISNTEEPVYQEKKTQHSGFGPDGPPQRAQLNFLEESDHEQQAASKIQAAFRHYLTRRAFRASWALVRIQALARGRLVRKQASIALRCLQALVKIQALARGWRVRASELGQLVQKYLQQSRQQRKKPVEGWVSSMATLQQLQAKAQSKQDAILKRQRAMVYTVSEQLHRSATKLSSSSVVGYQPNKNYWVWVWLERWMAARTWRNPTGVAGGQYKTNEKSKTRIDGERHATGSEKDGELVPSLKNGPTHGMILPHPEGCPAAKEREGTSSLVGKQEEQVTIPTDLERARANKENVFGSDSAAVVDNAGFNTPAVQKLVSSPPFLPPSLLARLIPSPPPPPRLVVPLPLPSQPVVVPPRLVVPSPLPPQPMVVPSPSPPPLQAVHRLGPSPPPPPPPPPLPVQNLIPSPPLPPPPIDNGPTNTSVVQSLLESPPFLMIDGRAASTSPVQILVPSPPPVSLLVMQSSVSMPSALAVPVMKDSLCVSQETSSRKDQPAVVPTIGYSVSSDLALSVCATDLSEGSVSGTPVTHLKSSACATQPAIITLPSSPATDLTLPTPVVQPKGNFITLGAAESFSEVPVCSTASVTTDTWHDQHYSPRTATVVPKAFYSARQQLSPSRPISSCILSSKELGSPTWKRGMTCPPLLIPDMTYEDQSVGPWTPEDNGPCISIDGVRSVKEPDHDFNKDEETLDAKEPEPMDFRNDDVTPADSLSETTGRCDASVASIGENFMEASSNKQMTSFSRHEKPEEPSSPSVPNYMMTTKSSKAKIHTLTSPRQRLDSPKQKIDAAKQISDSPKKINTPNKQKSDSSKQKSDFPKQKYEALKQKSSFQQKLDSSKQNLDSPKRKSDFAIKRRHSLSALEGKSIPGVERPTILVGL